VISSLLRTCRIIAAGIILIGAPATTSVATTAAPLQRRLYAVDEAASDRGRISVYDIDADNRLIKTISTVPNIGDVKGAAASAVTGKFYVTYIDTAGVGRIYCLDLTSDKTLWDKALPPGVDRLAIEPLGRLLFVPTSEGGTADFINVADAATGEIVRRVPVAKQSHDTQYPISGPVFQETKADDGNGRFLYRIDPQTYAVSRIGPYSGVLGPYVVDSRSHFVVNDVRGLWGMQVADLVTGRIATGLLPQHPQREPGLMHGIGWTPDEREVWQTSSGSDPHIYIWDMSNPMAPVFKRSLTLRSGRGSHWLTFTIGGDYAYIAPEKNSSEGTEIFDVRRHAYVGTIGSSEDMLEIDFADGKVSRVGDQFGIGRR
jgi:hypothetical protein